MICKGGRGGTGKRESQKWRAKVGHERERLVEEGNGKVNGEDRRTQKEEWK